MMVIAAGRDEGSLGSVSLHQFEAEHAAIETERAIEIGNLQMDMANPRSCRNRLNSIAHGNAFCNYWRYDIGAVPGAIK